MAKRQKNLSPFPRTLREQAEARVLAAKTDITGMPADEVQALVYELHDRYLEAHLARQEAEKISRAKDKFLAMVSHELRTPLTPIVAWSRLLCSEKLDGANQTRALDSIERNASMLSQLIEDLLDISGFIAGKIRLDVQPVDLVGIVNAAINVVRHEADSKAIQIETQFDTDAVPLSGDSERLQQVIWNLLSNAIKFTPAGGRITVRLERLANAIEIIVRDTGRGIPADFLPHVFDPFRQAEELSAKGRRGLGLGLAIVRQIVQLHGGTIAAASAGEGRGSTFTVAVPTRLTHETGAADSCPPSAA
jgi:signal transduction histidine kinase